LQLHYHREFKRLNTEIAKLGGLVEDAVGKALLCLRKADPGLAQTIVESDNLIDRLEVEIEEQCVRFLALYHPVARDLRFIVTILKINNELEHVGDLARSVATKAPNLAAYLQGAPGRGSSLLQMGARAQRMLSLALDSLLKEDLNRAYEVLRMDHEVDAGHRQNQQAIYKKVEAQQEAISLQDLALLSVSRSFEGVADIATNVARDVIYFVDAKIVRHQPQV
jgi:phosphate transport system protein